MGRKDRAALRRIIALLLALADLAEAACGRSRPVRWLVLSILGLAEPVARDFIDGLTGVPALTRPPLVPLDPDAGLVDADTADDGIARAMRLASAFRVLAAALAAAFAALPDDAAAPTASIATDLTAAFRSLMASLPVERRDSS